jgi:hypothetical protein
MGRSGQGALAKIIDHDVKKYQEGSTSTIATAPSLGEESKATGERHLPLNR